MLRVQTLIQDDVWVIRCHVTVNEQRVGVRIVRGALFGAVQTANAHAIHATRHFQAQCFELFGHPDVPVFAHNEISVPDHIQGPVHQWGLVANEVWDLVLVSGSRFNHRTLGACPVQPLNLFRDHSLSDLCVGLAAEVHLVLFTHGIAKLNLLLQRLVEDGSVRQVIHAVPTNDHDLFR